MTDPIKAIQTVKNRLARLAALQALAAMLPPLILIAAVALGLTALGRYSWERWELTISAHTVRLLQIGLLWAVVVGAVAAAVFALVSFRRNEDPIAAAELIDLRLGCRQEVLTLATLAGSAPASERSPLFPVLWRRAAQHLDRLDPVRAFPFQVKQSLRQAFFLTVCTVGLIAAGISVLLAANKPPLAAEGRQLRRVAREIANSATGDAQTQKLAARLRAVADTLENPNVPPESKMEQLASVQQQVKAQQQRRQQEAEASNGKSSAKGNGKGSQDQGEGKEGSGQGKQGSGPGQGKGGANGNGSGSGSGKNGKGEVQLAQASRDISKIQARLESEAKTKSAEQAGGKLKARAPRPGEQPDFAKLEKAGSSSNLNQFKSNHGNNQEQGNTQRAEQGQPRRDFGSSKGDTHLGEFPRPGNFERFYKTGEHGEPLDVKNARYVLFRIPPALIGAGGGKPVVDNDRSAATVPYANLPLKEERIAADPDERQLVPPRYRDLLR
ncbi:MAG TPA: hypothetical protein VKB84_12385 [Candidatus Binataceae bacterium]|nr:hypothetical protein [Candidatus Binataceae bacterium]